MREICVKSLPLKDVIKDLADGLGTEPYEECEEYRLKIPENLGSGYIQGINFPSGLGIILYRCYFKDDVVIRFNVNDIHPAKFLYVTEGSLRHFFEDEDSGHQIEKYQSSIVASSGKVGHILKFEGGCTTHLTSLEINREIFTGYLANCTLEGLQEKLRKLICDTQAHDTFYYKGDYSLRMADAITEIEEYQPTGVVHKLFLEGASYQMLTYQIVQYEDDQKGEGHQQILRRSERDTIMEALRIIETELGKDISVKELTRRLGTNENKMQDGFKRLTGHTINQYVQIARLNAAKELLISTDLSISEIVYNIGLSNRGYFSRIFKERYGVSPSVFRKRQDLYKSAGRE